MKVVGLYLFILNVGLIHGYRVLGIYGLAVKSHFVLFEQLFKGLSRKGHQVDYISPFPQEEKYPNCTQIFQFPNPKVTSKDNIKLNFETITNFSQNRNTSFIGAFGYQTCQNIGFSKFVNLAYNPPKKSPYDVIITHMFSYHCFMILGHLWNVPVVLVSTSSMYPWMYDMIGSPENVAFSPNNMFPIPAGNSFWSRYLNTYYFYTIKLRFLYDSRNQNELLQKYFGPDVPDIRELEQSVSLVLMNTYFPINGAKPVAKGVVEIGGIHIQNETSELSGNLKKWLDDSEHGVIYFNLGSILRFETFPKDTVRMVFESLRQLEPKRVLMRISNPDKLTVKIPNNFYTLPWIPQEKVLQHPNVKLFITHGGLLGTQESIYYGVPMLCLPVMADQFTNTQIYVQKKIATTIDVFNMNKKKFNVAITEVLNNPNYTENVKRLSRVFRDRPLNAVDTATFWIEFVVRHGKDVLRSPAMDFTWWQLALLDVLVVTLLGLLIILYLIFFVIKTVLSRIFFKRRRTLPKQKKT